MPHKWLFLTTCVPWVFRNEKAAVVEPRVTRHRGHPRRQDPVHFPCRSQPPSCLVSMNRDRVTAFRQRAPPLSWKKATGALPRRHYAKVDEERPSCGRFGYRGGPLASGSTARPQVQAWVPDGRPSIEATTDRPIGRSVLGALRVMTSLVRHRCYFFRTPSPPPVGSRQQQHPIKAL